MSRRACEYEQSKRAWAAADTRVVDLGCEEIGDRYTSWRPEEPEVIYSGAYSPRAVGQGPPESPGPSFQSARIDGDHIHCVPGAPFNQGDTGCGEFVDDTGWRPVVYPGHWTEDVYALDERMGEVVMANSWRPLWTQMEGLPDVCYQEPAEARDTESDGRDGLPLWLHHLGVPR
jgi:hypothetical protein